MYGKHFQSMYTGSMCGAGADIFAVWGYVIAHSVSSTVELNPKLIAFTIGMTPERVIAAIDYLCQPDPSSRTPDEEGRRLIKEGTFQYFVVTHEKHRAIRDEESRREGNRTRKRRQREREKSHDVTPVTLGHTMSRVSPHTEAEAEAEKTALVERTFVSYCTVLKKNPKTYTLTPERKKKALLRMEERLAIHGGDIEPVTAEFKKAIANLAASDFHRSQGHTDWTGQIFRSADEFEKRINWTKPVDGNFKPQLFVTPQDDALARIREQERKAQEEIDRELSSAS